MASLIVSLHLRHVSDEQCCFWNKKNTAFFHLRIEHDSNTYLSEPVVPRDPFEGVVGEGERGVHRQVVGQVLLVTVQGEAATHQGQRLAWKKRERKKQQNISDNDLSLKP